jgi:hypothetical protein
MRFANENGYYELNDFPGNHQIVVSNHAHIHPHLRGKGLGQIEHLQRLHKMRDLGYDYTICTVAKDNEVQSHILNKMDWRELASFWVPYTGEILLYGRPLLSIPKTIADVKPRSRT